MNLNTHDFYLCFSNFFNFCHKNYKLMIIKNEIAFK